MREVMAVELLAALRDTVETIAKDASDQEQWLRANRYPPDEIALRF